MVPDWVGAAIVKADCIRVKPDTSLALPRYLDFALNFEQTRKRTAKIIHGVGRPRLNLTEIKSIQVPLAPLGEQRRILAKIEELFSDLDAGVAALERVRANLKRYRAAVLKAAVEGKLTEDWRAQHPDIEPASVLLERILTARRRQWEHAQLAKFAQEGKAPPQGVNKRYKVPCIPPGDRHSALPGGWCWATLDELMWKIVDGTHHPPTYKESGVPFISVKDVRDGRVYFDDCKFISESQHDELSRRCKPELGDLLVTKSGTIGRVAVVKAARPFSLFVSVALAKPSGHELLIDWVSTAFQEWMSRTNVANDIKGSTIKNLHLEDMRVLRIPLPPISEQRVIISDVDRHLSVIEKVDNEIVAQLKRSSRLRQGILKRAFEGRLVSQDPTDEPAEKLLGRMSLEVNGTPHSATRLRQSRQERHSKSEKRAQRRLFPDEPES